MSKKKFNLSNEFVKLDKKTEKETIDLNIQHNNGRLTGPHSNRVAFSTSINPDLKNRFKIWVTKKNSDMSTEIEKAITKAMIEH